MLLRVRALREVTDWVCYMNVSCSVASWAVFPHNWAVYFVAVRDFFCCCGLRFFGLV